MWLFLEDESFVLAETIIICLLSFVFQLFMCRCKHTAVKLIPIYVFAAWHTVLNIVVISLTSSANWAVLLVIAIYIVQIIVESAFIGLAWLIYLISRKRKRNKNDSI